MSRSGSGTKTVARPFTRAEVASIHAYKLQKASGTLKLLTPKQVQASVQAELAVVGGHQAQLMAKVADVTHLSLLKIQEVLDAITIEAGKAPKRKVTQVHRRQAMPRGTRSFR